MSESSSQSDMVFFRAEDLPPLDNAPVALGASGIPGIPGTREYGTPDEENPEWTDEEFAHAALRREEATRIPVEDDLLEWFSRQGPDIAGRINQVLRDHVERHRRTA